MFVIQDKFRDKWFLRSGPKYKTLDEARAALEKLPMNHSCRIAEEYTVTRYKAVRN